MGRRVSAILFLVPLASVAEDPVSCLPVPLPDDSFAALRANSPFERVLSFSEAYSLRAVARIGNESVARLYNRKTRETVTVRESEANDLGMQLVSVNNDLENLEGVTVLVSLGGERVEFGYQREQLKPRPAPRAKVYQYDKWGRAVAPKELMQKYYSMNNEQKAKYQRWRAELIKSRPEMAKGENRFPISEKAIDAIRQGKEPPKPSK